MNMNELLDQMIRSGKDLGQKGQAIAEEQLNLPKEGPERDAKLSNLKTGAAAAGVLALLLGTKAGRNVTGAGLKIGTLAALGGVAYQMYNHWQQKDDTAASPGLLAAPEQPPVLSSAVLLRAMVAAAKADGHVDAQELAVIRNKLAELHLEQDANELLLGELVRPTTASEVAALAKGDPKAALEIYLVSALVADQGNTAEQLYLSDLQAALNLPDAAVTVTLA